MNPREIEKIAGAVSKAFVSGALGPTGCGGFSDTQVYNCETFSCAAVYECGGVEVFGCTQDFTCDNGFACVCLYTSPIP